MFGPSDGWDLLTPEQQNDLMDAEFGETSAVEVSPRDFEAMTEDQPGRVLPGLRAMVEKVRGGSDE